MPPQIPLSTSPFQDFAASLTMAMASVHIDALSHVSIRSYDEATDCARVDELEKLCDAGSSGSASLFTDLLGDPLCRVRHFPLYSMLVAEIGSGSYMTIVGMIRAGIKEVSCGRSASSSSSSDSVDGTPIFARTAYILGLRIAPQYRRRGIAAELVRKMEKWCREQGAEYAYIATEKNNEASVSLFTKKLDYLKFRTPAILVQPVYARSKKISKRVKIVEVGREKAEKMYREVFKEAEFFPKDVDAILKSRLNKGTWMAMWEGEEAEAEADDGEGTSSSSSSSSSSWAMLSIWKCNEIFKLEVKGAKWRIKALAMAARAFARLLPISIPTPPDVFRPFGVQFAYGLHAHGPSSSILLRQLLWFAHNLAMKDGCSILASELSSVDPLLPCVPRWPCLSCDEDLCCIKRLSTSRLSSSPSTEWCKKPPSAAMFVDPRDF